MDFLNRTKKIIEYNVEKIQSESYFCSNFGFVSLLNGAGTSTLAANTASLLSKQEKKVLLLDANFHQPNLFYFFDGLEVPESQSLSMYFANKIEEKELNIRVPGHENLWLISTSPKDRVDKILQANEDNLGRLMEYVSETFDFVIADIPYLPMSEWFIEILERMDKSIIVWDEQNDCGYKTLQMLEFLDSHSDCVNMVKNVVVNKRTKRAYELDKIKKEFNCNYVCSVPYIDDMDELKAAGELIINSGKMSRAYGKEFYHMVDYLLSNHKTGTGGGES
ncbi:tyrosine-protein kinase family protein [Paenibacillus sp. S-38]|uniref:tyrosine-protein kinase family protein n=1 Tax=Paenibacillus sp. S-38 TaxID=3416710 RepID=UPI003CFAFC1D